MSCSSSAICTRRTSAGLSSTRTMVTELRPESRFASLRDRKVKRRSAAGSGFDPDPAAGAFDDAFTDGQPHAAPGVLCGTVKTFKEFKNLLLVAWIDADPVVLNCKSPAIVFRFRGYLDFRGEYPSGNAMRWRSDCGRAARAGTPAAALSVKGRA